MNDQLMQHHQIDDHFVQVDKMVRTGSKIQNRRVSTFSVPTHASSVSAWAKKHAHPTPVNFYIIVRADSQQEKRTIQECSYAS